MRLPPIRPLPLKGLFLITAFIGHIYSPALAAPVDDTDDLMPPATQAEQRIFSTAGDAKRGKIVFMRCKACHNERASKTTKSGPNLDQLFGRTAGQDEDYDGYSKALKQSGIVWDEAQLNSWLKNPKGFLPGNKMSFSGIRIQKDRNDLMAYMRSLEIKPKQ